MSGASDFGSKVSHRNVDRDSHLGSIGIDRCQRPDNDESATVTLGGPELPSNARRTSGALDQDAVWSFGLLASECRTGAGGTVARDQPDSDIEGEI